MSRKSIKIRSTNKIRMLLAHLLSDSRALDQAEEHPDYLLKPFLSRPDLVNRQFPFCDQDVQPGSAFEC